MTFRASTAGQFLRQRIDDGLSFTGSRTSHGDGVDRPAQSEGRILTYDQSAIPGEGLFELTSFISTPQPVFLTWLRVIVGGNVAWNAYITDGLNGGGATLIDDLFTDALIATGTGNSVVALNVDIPWNSRLRVTTGIVIATYGLVEVEFFPTSSKFERIIN